MKYKYNGQWYDIAVKALDSMAIGCIIQFMGNTIPTGWLECDGSSITQLDYPELYALIGGTLPNFKGRVLVGQDTSQTEFDTLGETGGEKTHKLTVNEMPSHSHKDGTDGGSGINAGSGSSSAIVYFNSALGRGTTETGGDQAHNNLQPYAVVKHIIKAKNTVPTMASMVNSYSNSTTNGYSCDYINEHFTGKVLYENASGTSDTIVLDNNESAANYSSIKIEYIVNDGAQYGNTVETKNGMTCDLIYIYHLANPFRSYIKDAMVEINGATITFIYNMQYTAGADVVNGSYIKITKIIGYK